MNDYQQSEQGETRDEYLFQLYNDLPALKQNVLYCAAQNLLARQGAYDLTPAEYIPLVMLALLTLDTTKG